MVGNDAPNELVRPEWVPEDAGEAFTTSVMPGVDASAPSRLAVRVPHTRSRRLGPDELATGVLAGNRTRLAQAITLIESNAPRHRSDARDLLTRLMPHSGKSLRIGITGVPGAGKSTLIEALGNRLCDLGHKVAVLTIDPSSSISGGSVLGDKTRMETLSRREECFIRPSPSGGALGGVTRKTRETILACEAAGFDVVIVETVGVGQNEITVRGMVDCFLLILIAGAGDELQGIKKGVFEIADVLAVNKADGDNRVRAEATRAQFERVLHYLTPATEGWHPAVFAVSALERSGLDALWEGVKRHAAFLGEKGLREKLRRDQDLTWMRSLVEQELVARFFNDPAIAERCALLEREVASARLPAAAAAELLLATLPRGRADSR
jgi:LAO/AO transport system kinase